jgi:hypothetical protein
MIGVLQITNFKCVRSLRLEEWILAAANEAGLDVRAYGLPRTPRQLHGAINTNLDKFERLLHVLGFRPSPRLKTLGELLS